MTAVAVCAVAIALLVVAGLIAWAFREARDAGATDQTAAQLTRTNDVQHAMLQAAAGRPADPAALDRVLRDGAF